MELIMSNILKQTTLVSAIALAMSYTHAATTANNNQEDKVVTLPTIVVTASKSAENIKDVPARIEVIDQQHIEQNPTLNLSDLLLNQPSIYIKQNGGLGQGTNLSIRGTNYNHTLLLKDGARLTTPNDFSPIYPEQLDMTDASRIEILKGPSSVQYGSDAVGGVVQIISATPEKNSASVTGIYGENNTYKALIGADLVENGFYAQVRGQRMESDGARIFDTQAKNQKAAYEQKGYSAKVGYDNQDNIKASVSINQNKGTNDYSDNYGFSNNARRQFENQLINVNAEVKPTQELTISTRYSNFKDQQTFVDSNPMYSDTKRNEGDLNAKWQFAPTQNILVGASFDNTEYKNASILYAKQSIDSAGYYIQHQYKTDKLNTQLGLRVEDNEKFGTHTVGQMAARYFVLPTTSVYANIGTAFRAPSLTELYYFYESPGFPPYGSYNSYGNPDLKPEESTAYEIGLDHQITDNLSTSVSVYQTNVKNLINSNSVYDSATNSTTARYENINKAKFQGGELGLKWKQDDLFLATEYAYVRAKNQQTDLDIAYRPRQTLTLTTGLENSVYGVSASLVARSESNAQNTANSVKVPGYATVDLNAYWNINPNVKVFTNIQNVGDVEYRTVYNFSNWYINNGRFASAGVTFKY